MRIKQDAVKGEENGGDVKKVFKRSAEIVFGAVRQRKQDF